MSSKKEQEFLDYVKKMESFSEALSLIFWDLRTGAPKKGVDQRSEVIGQLSSEVFKMSTSEQMKEYIEDLSLDESLNDITKKSIEECKKEYEKNKKIPPEEYHEYVKLTSKAEAVWEEAKEKSDFKMFQPYLEKLVEFNKKFISYWGYEGNKYNTLLDLFEPGMTVEVLDDEFKKLRDRIVPLVQAIQSKGANINTKFIFESFPKESQKQFSLEILKEIGYDFDAGRLDETVHPFAIGLNPGDVRITTKFDEGDFRTAIFGTIHEAGHALYEQNISMDLVGTPLCTGTSMGIHESQSLFMENFVGRSYSFWERYYNILKKHSNGQFDQVELADFYNAINESKASLIRIEADELTYPLHVMVRYEIEKGLFNDEIKVEDLPQVWNEKMRDYLGVTPENDAQGLLQDVHWSGGAFGYFPSYALGYMYAAQFKKAMDQDIPNFEERIKNGDIESIREWLTENIHQYGKMKTPLRILKDVTGEGLNAKPLVDYLEEKYKRIYQLS